MPNHEIIFVLIVTAVVLFYPKMGWAGEKISLFIEKIENKTKNKS